MPTTRKKVIKTVYRDEDDSDEGGDFSDSGSDAVLSQPSSSEEDNFSDNKSDDDFKSKAQKSNKRKCKTNKTKNISFAKSFISKIKNNTQLELEDHDGETPFSVKNLTDADKLLPSVLNLSESESSDDETTQVSLKKDIFSIPSSSKDCDTNDDSELNTEYKDVWSQNIAESEEIARKTYLELEIHKKKIEETKISVQNYVSHTNNKAIKAKEADIKDLLALGEEESPDKSYSQVIGYDDSDTEKEDWEEVKESKGIPQQGLQLIVNIPDGVCRKSKKVDVEMMMKRKINRVKKEHQIHMHKVHILCWLGHGNYINHVLNDQDILSAVLSLVPSKECYPGERVDMKYIEEITKWYKNKITLKQDKHENKFKPKAPPLKTILLQQIKNKVFTTKKYIVFAFVSMLRSLGLQCRVMLNFVTVPIKPPHFELCSLSTKPKDIKENSNPDVKSKEKTSCSKRSITAKTKIPQLDGIDDSNEFDHDFENIMQLDGNNDNIAIETRKGKNTKSKSVKHQSSEVQLNEEDVSPPKRPKRHTRLQTTKSDNEEKQQNKLHLKKTHNDKKSVPGNKKSVTENKKSVTENKKSVTENKKSVPQNKRSVTGNKNTVTENKKSAPENKSPIISRKSLSLNREKSSINEGDNKIKSDLKKSIKHFEPTGKTPRSKIIPKKCSSDVKETSNPKIIITGEIINNSVSSKYFESNKNELPCRKRSRTFESNKGTSNKQTKPRTRSVQAKIEKTSKYFENADNSNSILKSPSKMLEVEGPSEDNRRVSHKDLLKQKQKSKTDVTGDLINIIKGRVKEAKTTAKLGIVKGKIKKESDDDSDHLPVETPKRKKYGSDDDFKPTKVTPKSKVSSLKKKDRRVLSTDDDEPPQHRVDVWAEVFVEELEQWISVDVIKGVHSTNQISRCATHPITYVVGWDNNNKLKDLTRKYVSHWNTVTRKQRVEPQWWDVALRPWLGPRNARDKEEDERLDRMQLEAPLPKSIAEYKNHPLYALSRHLLKFEAIYPPDAPALGFVRGEPVYARACVHVCRSRDTWLKEAKVVRLGEQPYKVVKARPKWDKLSNKLITDKPLEVFGPWQVQDYEPPTAENGVVPRNAYGNVELFKECMLPKGTVHIKLPGLNRVAKKWNIDCAPAMTGFEFNGGWSHPVYDGFVVCKEFEEIITEAWLKDQEEQERKEVEKLEARVYGNWKKLIKGLLIKERLKAKYGFEDPSTSKETAKPKGPRLVVKKK